MKKYINENEFRISFEINKRVYVVEPQEIIEIEDKYAYAIPQMGVRITDMDSIQVIDDEPELSPEEINKIIEEQLAAEEEQLAAEEKPKRGRPKKNKDKAKELLNKLKNDE